MGTDAGRLVLGLDPGLAITGYGVIATPNGAPELVEAGVLRMRKDRPLGERLKELYEGLQDIFSSLAVTDVAIEQ